MVLDMSEYTQMINKLNINIIYSGPMWEDGIRGIAEVVKIHLSHDNLPGSAAKSIFSVFVEQVTNMLMYSAEKETFSQPGQDGVDVSMGMLVLVHKNNKFFIQTRNSINNEHIALVKGRIDHLNTLDKKELRQYQKERIKEVNDNPESRGAGLGLIVVARRATSPIEYEFERYDDQRQYFTMYISIGQGEKG